MSLLALMFAVVLVLVGTAAAVDWTAGAAKRRFDEIAQSRVHGFPFLFGLGNWRGGRGSRKGLFWVKALDGDLVPT